jgi:hypothetical protein
MVMKALLFDCVVMIAYVLLMKHLTAMPWINRAHALLFDSVLMIAYVLLMQHLTQMAWIYMAHGLHHRE